MSDRELIKFLQHIEDKLKKTTTGNLAHEKANILSLLSSRILIIKDKGKTKHLALAR